MGSDSSCPKCPKYKSCDEYGYILPTACPKCKSCNEQGYILPTACPSCSIEQDKIKSLEIELKDRKDRVEGLRTIANKYGNELTNARVRLNYYNRFLEQPGIDIGKFKDWRGKWFLIYNNAEGMKRHVSTDGKHNGGGGIVLREKINPENDYFTVDFVGHLICYKNLHSLIYAPNWSNGGVLYIAGFFSHEPVDCAGQWKLYDNGRIGPRNGTKKFWDIPANSQAPEGSKIQVWDDDDFPDRQWTLKEVQIGQACSNAAGNNINAAQQMDCVQTINEIPAETFSLHNESNVLNKVVIALIVLAILFVCAMTWIKMHRINDNDNISSLSDSSD